MAGKNLLSFLVLQLPTLVTVQQLYFTGFV